MKFVSELYGKHPQSDIYIVGTGASVRTFPVDFLKDKITIGLNQAWKIAPVKYCITMRPELNIPEFMAGESPRPEITWITKFEKLRNEEQKAYGEEHFYIFESDGGANTAPPDQPSTSGRVLDWVKAPTKNYLYLWSTISGSAMNLAANLGARNIILIGCDNCALGGNHHAHSQHTFWKNAAPDRRYEQYYEGTIEVRSALRERGVNVMSLTPFVNLLEPTRDFNLLCQELGVPSYIDNPDITPPKPNFFLQKAKGAARRLKRLVAFARSGEA